MPKYPGTMNGAGYFPQQPQRRVEVNFPWPPGQMATSNREMKSRADVETTLKELRGELLKSGLSANDFVWALKRNPAGLLMFYMFHADCVPSVATPVMGTFREPWVWRYMSDDPPPAEEWEVKFRVLNDAARSDEVREAGQIRPPDEPAK